MVSNMNPKVCLVTNLALNDEPTVENRLLPYIDCLGDKKADVTLFSTDSELKQGICKKVKHTSIFSERQRPKSFVKRAIFEWRESRRILKKASVEGFDLYIVTIPSMFLLFNLYLLKGKNVCLDVRDLTWEYLDDGSLVQRLSKFLFRTLADVNVKYSSYQIVTNDTEYEYMSKRRGEVLKYSNGVTEEQFKELNNLSTPSPDSVFTITYCGKVGVAQNLSIFIEAASLLPDFNFKIVGYGPQTEEVEALAKEKNISNVEFTGHVNWSEVLKHYNGSHVLYAQLGPLFSGAMPSKLFQYLATGRYVIYGGEGQAEETLKQFKMSRVIPSNNVDKLVEAIKLAKSHQLIHSESEFNKSLIAEQYVREKNVSRVLETIL